MSCARAGRKRAAVGLAMLALAGAALSMAGNGAAVRLTREEVVGVWRLVRIEYSGPHGARVDPFYQTGSTGLLIYDPSGWMEVQIAAPHRQLFEVPQQRTGAAPTADAAAKAGAFDSYYAYDGTWELDAASSVLTHHVLDSLIPAEAGKTYTQQVSLENGRLVFTNRSGGRAAETVRRKIWERADAPRSSAAVGALERRTLSH